MTRIYVKVAIVTAIAVIATQVLSHSIRALLDMPADGLTNTLATLLPIVVTIPISLYVFRQTAKLDRAYAALVAANEALARKASRDQMTGLLNRESFLGQVDVTRLLPAGGTLLIIDADHFKAVNDRFGHPTGDEALIRIAAAIAESIRKGDLTGRIGGEEFSAFLTGADRPEALRVAQRLRAAVEAIDFRSLTGEVIRLTVSVGGAVAGKENNLGDLMREADGCLYEAKRGGRNRVTIETGLAIAAA